ncbi:TIGR03668 family PPOX class F420-dependent oxidoreductase [Frankia sp. R82]|uniref:TIGR03668 family PPOX class F420-dependent oxidoreductase n=1 Tax=Frankia sp. R82 TaxID=2950553 RepID=UPI00204457FE|nr:TIGR03668 family PPOX class F420-dependent oxidoreductase [Frankia sp. R82]MCM3884589.1 TIGR03668 family PPOX class F420-dependent oxidoreductase [Frankia sp. R82]
MRFDSDQARQRFAAARVARLATSGLGGPPLVVPVTFAVTLARFEAVDHSGGAAIVTVVDHRPKRTRTGLRRLRDILANPAVSLLADHYDDDWSRLWWARADGLARIVLAGEQEHTMAVEALAARYPQYQSLPPTGPAIIVSHLRWSGWAAIPTVGGAEPTGDAGRDGDEG